MKTLLALSLLILSPGAAGAGGGQAEYRVTRPMEIHQRLHQAYLAKGASYRPRTGHFNPDGSPRHINRLILEDSPYLLQHAHNPVDWYPWGEEAFAKAARERKPIFLSIGYSTCHWCHVMERESFEDPAIARLLNDQFVAVKLDRESRPDLDEVYMGAVMLLNGHGGWPLSSFLTAEGKPFFGGTYFPPEQFERLLGEVVRVWRDRQSDLLAQADRIAESLAVLHRGSGSGKALPEGLVQEASSRMLSAFDEIQGGFGQAPKFPHEPWLFLLLNQAERRNDRAALEAVETTLDAMARGGIYDQAGGGFHRYATDNGWLVPHFEKMLYNQAHLARIYLLAWRLTGKEPYRRVAVQTLDYVLREMRDPEGAFHSATDADSEGAEGTFFLWTPAQIRAALSQTEADLAIGLYGITGGGNFEGSNILHLPLSLETFAARNGLAIEELRQRLDRINGTLRAVRDGREHPLRDDKVITAWNGMMITTLALAADLLDAPAYGEAAERAAKALWQRNRRGKGELWRNHLNGRSSVDGLLEDYAYLGEGLIQLYDLNGNRLWLERAAELADAVLERFPDASGGFYLNEAASNLGGMGRPLDGGSDNATPSGSSVMLHLLQRLWVRTGELKYQARAEVLIKRLAPAIEQAPTGYAYLLTGAEDIRQGELGPRRYAGQGAIRIEGNLQPADGGQYRLNIELAIPPGWHINADRPLDDKLVPTRIELKGAEGWSLSEIRYPTPVRQQLDFQAEPLLLYADKVRLEARVSRGGKGGTPLALPLSVRLQACSTKACLPPEELVLSLPLRL